jgi:hypothetical protein
MKTIALFLLMLAPSYAGVTRFTAKHIVAPPAKLAGKGIAKAAKLAWKIAF